MFLVPLATSSFLLLFLWSLPQVANATSAEAIGNFLKSVLWSIISNFFGFFVWIGGSLLDYAIQYFVVDFGQQFRDNGFGFAVNSLWTVVRDLFNLTFIFALVYIGFKLILGGDDSGAKRAIVNLIIAALLVNFSLFFTKAIIDFTNITATQVANVIYNGQPPATTGSISATFMDQMGLATIFGPSRQATNPDTITWAYILGTMILCLIAAFAFLAGAVLLTIRFIALNYFMVLSPMMFIGRVLPFMESQQKNFWKSFLNNAFFAPIFLLLVYFSLFILQQMGQTRATASLHDLFNSTNLTNAPQGVLSAETATSVVFFLLAGGFLIGSVLIAQKMSVLGGSAAISVGQNLRARGQRLVGSMTLGTGAAIGQRTLGLAASRLSDSDKFKDFVSRRPFIGRAAYMTTQKVADSSFDVRQTTIGKTLNVGEGKKGGYESRVKEKTKQYEAFLDAIGTNDDLSDREAQALAQASIQNSVAGRQLILENQQAAEALVQRRNELQNEISGDLNEIRVLATEMRAQGTTQERKQQIANQINAINTSIQSVRERFSADLAQLQQQATAASKALDTRMNQETQDQKNSYKYKKQLQFIQSLEDSNRRFGAAQRVLGGTLGFAASAATLGSIPAIYSVPAGAALIQAASTAGIVTSDATKKLRGAYGKNGTKKQKKKQQQDQLQLVADSLRDSGTIPTAAA
jgi:hypothetical protein